jgi:arylsulfatase A-like enzyme
VHLDSKHKPLFKQRAMKYKIMFAGAVLAGGTLSNCMAIDNQVSDNQNFEKTRSAKKPNILFIMTDQHNAQFLSCLGRTELRTPNFDALAEQSVIFSSTYSASPVSGPSRATVFTGMYPAQNGIYTNWVPLEDESSLLTWRLDSAGYYNAMIGKLHLSPIGESHGFHFRRMCDSPYDLYDKEEVVVNDYLPWVAKDMGISLEKIIKMAGESEHIDVHKPGFWLGWNWTDNAHQITSWTGDETVSFINSYKKEQPFFMHVSFFGPHHPYSAGEPWDSMYDPEEVSLPPTFGQVQPGAQHGIRLDWPEAQWREVIAKYSGNISAIDHQIGRIIAALKKQGMWENTLIVFTADHGDHMGDFSQLSKSTMLESSVRVPFFIKPPGARSVKREFSEVISLIDLYPTFLDYAGITDDRSTNSRSLRKLLAGETTWHNEVYSSLCSKNGKRGQVMYIKDQFKCVGFLKDGKMNVELYDRTAKVPDLINLAEDPAYIDKKEELESILVKWVYSSWKE